MCKLKQYFEKNKLEMTLESSIPPCFTPQYESFFQIVVANVTSCFFCHKG